MYTYIAKCFEYIWEGNFVDVFISWIEIPILKSLWKMMFKLLPLAVAYPEMSTSKKSHFQINDIHFRNV